MWPDRWSTFVGILVIILCVPGPDFFVIVRYSLAGIRAGFRAAAGNVTGLMVHTTLAAVGVSALVAARPAVLSAIRLIGAGYLAWLGIIALRAFLSRHGSVVLAGRRVRSGHAVSGTVVSDPPECKAPTTDQEARPCGDVSDIPLRDTPGAGARSVPGGWAMRPYRDGLATNLLNPKAVLFFVGVIPQFISPGGSVTAQTLVLAGTTLTCVVMWWAAVVLAVGRGVQPLIGPGWHYMMNGVTAVAFLGMAVSFVVTA